MKSLLLSGYASMGGSTRNKRSWSNTSCCVSPQNIRVFDELLAPSVFLRSTYKGSAVLLTFRVCFQDRVLQNDPCNPGNFAT